MPWRGRGRWPGLARCGGGSRRGRPDFVEELVVSADPVLGREREQAAVVQRPSCRGAGHDAGGAGADQGAQV